MSTPRTEPRTQRVALQEKGGLRRRYGVVWVAQRGLYIENQAVIMVKGLAI